MRVNILLEHHRRPTSSLVSTCEIEECFGLRWETRSGYRLRRENSPSSEFENPNCVAEKPSSMKGLAIE